MNKHKIILPSENRILDTDEGATLLSVLTAADCAPDAPCGGHGTCGKCAVMVDGIRKLSCQTTVNRSMTVTLPPREKTTILTDGLSVDHPVNRQATGYLLAIDIGTTSVVCYLLDGVMGTELANSSMLNPQAPFGADVITRIQAALAGKLHELTSCIRECLTKLILEVCEKSKVLPGEISTISIVGNPAMQQLFFGISPDNLVTIPFTPVLTETQILPAKDYIPVCEKADLLVIPNISGYVGADTLGCILATKQYEAKKMTLLVDIGTNGEMVLGDNYQLVACATAAGPALEGANIRFGMRGAPGAIDHVWLENGKIRCSVIGGGKAKGICGSGLIDAVSVFLDSGLINKRGRIQSAEELDGQRIVYLTPEIYLTQNDIREVQLAKGAIAAGIELMAEYLGITVSQIECVLLAGAFGSFMDSEKACRIGLLPEILAGKITTIGNAAGSGAKLLTCSTEEFAKAQSVKEHIQFIELASMPNFQRVFAKNMSFREGKS